MASSMQNEEDAETNKTHDDQVQLGCAFHPYVRMESQHDVYDERSLCLAKVSLPVALTG